MVANSLISARKRKLLVRRSLIKTKGGHKTPLIKINKKSHKRMKRRMKKLGRVGEGVIRGILGTLSFLFIVWCIGCGVKEAYIYLDVDNRACVAYYRNNKQTEEL